MSYITKTITEENFGAFKTLVEEVIKKATNASLENNPFIRKTNNSDNAPILRVPENKADIISKKIKAGVNSSFLGGKRLKTLIDAALNDEHNINTNFFTVDCMAAFVLKDKNLIEIENTIEGQPSYWLTYLYHFRRAGDIYNAEKDIISPHNLENRIDEGKSKDVELIAPMLNKATLLKGGLYGGACAGFFGVIFIVIMQYLNDRKNNFVYTGYEYIPFSYFLEMILPIVFVVQIIGGGMLGWLCCRNALINRSRLKCTLLFFLTFVILVFVRQAAVRDAWHPKMDFPYFDQHKKLIRFGGGILGEPDFEAVATGLMGAVAFLILENSLRELSFRLKTGKVIFVTILKSVIPALLTWYIVLLFYRIAVSFKILIPESYMVSRSVFIVEFPHPNRGFLLVVITAIYVYCVMAAIQYNNSMKTSERPV